MTDSETYGSGFASELFFKIFNYGNCQSDIVISTIVLVY